MKPLPAIRLPTNGQLARARLGLYDVVSLRSPPEPADANANEVLHAGDILYQIGEGDLALSFVTDLAGESGDPALIAGLGKLTRTVPRCAGDATRRQDGSSERFPNGVVRFSRRRCPIGSPLDRCMVYAIVRTESGFDQRDMSSAKAVGLMQVTPVAGRDTAKRFGVSYDWKRLVSDPVYNTQMGAAEASALLKDFRGSFVLTFAGYNAGRGRVEQWVAQHGDPRNPKIDAVDWVERIPFAETRNYVQRVMENLMVYRGRFGESLNPTYIALRRSSGAPNQPQLSSAPCRPRRTCQLATDQQPSASSVRARSRCPYGRFQPECRQTGQSQNSAGHSEVGHETWPRRPKTLLPLKSADRNSAQ